MDENIKLVIEIPEEVYKLLKSFDWESLPKEEIDELTAYEYAIAQGTPLPKGHGRLIDADKLYEQFGEVMNTVMREPKFTKDVEYILRTTATVKLQIKGADTIIEADTESET